MSLHAPLDFKLRFRGGLADEHALPASDLAQSLVALERLFGKVFLSVERKSPAKKAPSKHLIQILIAAPKQGSLEILPTAAHVLATAMPFVADLSEAVRSKLAEHALNFIMLFCGGRRGEAQQQLDRLLDIIQREAEARDTQAKLFADDRRHERETWERVFGTLAEACRNDARSLVYPIGKSCADIKLSTRTSGDTPVVIDEPTADAIRHEEDLVVSGIIDMEFVVDGIRLSSKSLFAFDPDVDNRRVTLQIVDPMLDPLSADNPYEDAVARRRRIKLTGKSLRYADGRLKTFYAMSGEVI